MAEKKYCPWCAGFLDRSLVEGRERQVCSDCGRVVFANPLPATAALVEGAQGILLVKRGVEPACGTWCLPGGFMEIDESPEECCLRELAEETGLAGEIDVPLGLMREESSLYGAVLVAGFAVRAVSGTPRAGDDTQEAAFFTPEALPEIVFSSHREFLARHLAARPRPLNGRPLFPRFGGAYVITSGDHLELARAACAAGARALQLRDKQSGPRELLALARAVKPLAAASGTLFIVNDSLEVAMLSGADGLHIGREDLPLPEIRKIAPPEMLIGVSTTNLEQVSRACRDGADYIGFGPVFATPTKEGYQPVGLEALGRALALSTVPVVPIGGIDLENMGQLKEAGAFWLAMVRAFSGDTGAAVRRVNGFFGLD